jgi:uncharacterized protein
VNPAGSAANRLCLACGLCCNGVLFADVRLAPGEASEALQAAGITLRRRANTCGFSQPCVALQANGACAVYADRPSMCRQFECGVLKDVAAGELSEAGALRQIRRAQKLAEKVRTLLVASGNHEDHRPLTKRYQAVMRQPIALADGDEAGDRRGELMLAVHELMALLHARFLSTERPDNLKAT